MAEFSHVDAADHPTMVDVSGKMVTARSAVAECRVRLPAAAATALRAAGYATAKGPVLHTAIVAGTLAAKRTHELIPFCHPLGVEKCRLTIEPNADDLLIRCEVAVHHRTGCEMEALTAVSVAALTLYDMCKALSPDIQITDTRLVEKHGGKSDYARPATAAAPLAALVLAGGKSARMRSDKAALAYGGESQLARIHRLVGSLVPDVHVSVRADQLADPARLAYARIVDTLHDVGPAAGTLAVDLPYLNRGPLERLIRARDPAALATAYHSRHDGLPEPLCAIWEPAARAPLAAAVAAGEPCPRRFLSGAAPRLIDLDDPAALDNVNTPAEYAAAAARLDTTAAP